MTFRGACRISILAQRHQIFVAPLLFSWMIIIHYILGITVTLITMLLIGVVVVVYQQSNAHVEDMADGFFDHCRFNGLHPFTYGCAKSLSVWICTLFPMTFILFILGKSPTQSFLIFSQWGTLSVCIACVLALMPELNPLNLLLGWLPLLTAPLIFLSDFLNSMNENTLLILLGCDIILISAVCVPFTFHKSYV